MSGEPTMSKKFIASWGRYVILFGLIFSLAGLTKTGALTILAEKVQGGSDVNSSENFLMLEAEAGDLHLVEVKSRAKGYSGTGYVGDFLETGAYVEQTFDHEGGEVRLSLGYYLPLENGNKQNSLYLNGTYYGSIQFEAGDGFQETVIGPMVLKPGTNTLRFEKSEGDWGYMGVDYFKLEPSDRLQHLSYEVAEALIDSQATPETKALYQYLRKIYGKRVLSGQQFFYMEEKENDKLVELTGSQPAMKGYDLLNCTQGAPAPDDQVARAIEWVEDGGIVTLCWHWFAPADGHAFYTEKTTFDVREAVKEGTPEHELILQDIDAIAEVLKDFQERDLPVIWRPLHEASGGWFWWGAQGAEPYQDLWRLLYHRLVDDHELHNLIWVANAQHPDWYVGDSYCDIIGEDIYGPKQTYSAYLPRFLMAYETVRGKKIMALTENGVLPSLDQMEETGAMWAWFMPWWGEFTETDAYTSDDVFQRTYRAESVVNREDLPDDLYVYGSLEDEEDMPEMDLNHNGKSNADRSMDEKQKPQELTKAQEMVKAMQPGWNLGNTFDAKEGETSWGNPAVTKDLIHKIKESGFKSIRIPVTWGHALGPSPDYTISSAYLERVSEVVTWALEADLKVMINLHHDSSWLYDLPKNRDLLLDRFIKIWEQVADNFKDYPDDLIFEAINEPRFSDDWGEETLEFFELVDLLNDSAYDVIRSSGGKNDERLIVFETLVAGVSPQKITRLRESILAKNDPHMIGSVHYYGHYPFGVNIGYPRFDQAVLDDIDRVMKVLDEGLSQHGIPVVIGEYGLLGFDIDIQSVNHGEILKFFDALSSSANQYGFNLIWWDNGQHLNRHTLEWRNPEIVEAIMQGLVGRSSQTESESYYLSQADLDQDLEIELILNGNQLESVKVEALVSSVQASGEVQSSTTESSQLALEDVLQGNKLILTPDTLSELGLSSSGDQVSLRLQFDEGPDWVVYLHVTQPAELSSWQIEGQTIQIDLHLNGGAVARVKLTDDQGKPVGQHGHQPYLQHLAEYRMDGDSLIIEGPAIKALERSDLHLEVEFWDGNVITKILERS